MQRSTEMKLRAWILAVAYLALIFGISSIPQDPLSRSCIRISDKIAHMAEYTGFGLLLTVAIRRSFGAAKPWVLLLVAVGVGAAIGALDETYQLTVPGRERELLDWMADVLGVVIGYLIASFMYRRSDRARAEAAAAA